MVALFHQFVSFVQRFFGNHGFGKNHPSNLGNCSGCYLKPIQWYGMVWYGMVNQNPSEGMPWSNPRRTFRENWHLRLVVTQQKTQCDRSRNTYIHGTHTHTQANIHENR